jgi:hypothetical protein
MHASAFAQSWPAKSVRIVHELAGFADVWAFEKKYREV